MDTLMHMPSGKEAASGPLARAVSAEVRATMARHRISGAKLANLVGMSQSYISRRLLDDAPFTLNDVEAICRALDERPSDFMAAALRSMGE